MKIYCKAYFVFFSLSLAVAGCGIDQGVDEIKTESEVLSGNDFPSIDISDDLSNTDLKSFVLENESFNIRVNDTLSLFFQDINNDQIAAGGDVVYSTSNGKGYITFSGDDIMSFMYSGEVDLCGSIFKDSKEKYMEQQRIDGRNAVFSTPLKSSAKHLRARGGRVSTTILGRESKNVVVEYFPKQDYNKLYDTYGKSSKTFFKNKDNLCRIMPSLEQIQSMEKQSRSFRGNRQYDFIDIWVYTLKNLSSHDINTAKMVTRSTLISAEIESFIVTHFDEAKNGNRIVNFDYDENDSGDLLEKWSDYRYDHVPYQYNAKYLLLTDLTFSDAYGVAYRPGRDAWANVSTYRHSTAAHEIAHMFGATHTDARWDWRLGWFGWWRTDVMHGSGWTYFTHFDHKLHANATNINIMRTHIDRQIN